MGVSLSIWGIDKRAENELEREAMKLRKQGFTLVEIMIVVSLVGLLATISVPAFQRSREAARQNACINNLRLIQDAKEQWILIEDVTDGVPADEDAVNQYLRTPPRCPSGGTYTYGDVNTMPTCDGGSDGFPHELQEASGS